MGGATAQLVDEIKDLKHNKNSGNDFLAGTGFNEKLHSWKSDKWQLNANEMQLKRGEKVLCLRTIELLLI